MPEGDTIHRTARTLQKALAGEVLTGAWSVLPRLEGLKERVGRTVARVEARGKHLLVCFDDGPVLHSHMMMTGSWHLYRPGESWRKHRRGAHAVLETATWHAVCFHAPVVELLPSPEASPALRALGPDLLAPELALEELPARFREHAELPIGVAVMRQSIVCGIGNVYKSEVLFLGRVNPFTPVRELSDASLLGILRLARRLLSENLRGYPRTTRRSFDGGRLWVYKRQKQPCRRCGTPISMRRQGDAGRSTYFCGRCQGVRPTSPR